MEEQTENKRNFLEESRVVLLDSALAKSNKRHHSYGYGEEYVGTYFIRGSKYYFIIRVDKNNLSIKWYRKGNDGPINSSFDEVVQSTYISEKAKNYLIFNLDFFRNSI
jgi:recombinational DNA repair protein RecT